jgi:RNA recognition motif-containing protein
VNIFVGNLSRDVTEDDLREAFAAYGKVSSAAVIKDKLTRESRGFGFVEMPEQAEAQAALTALNGSELKGQRLNVNEARPREERSGGGGGGRGYGGGGGGYGGGGGGGYGGGGGDRGGRRSFGDRDRRGDDRGRRSGGGGRRDDRRSSW